MKILIVKLADLGDLLISEPAIRSLRQAFPAADIDILTTPLAGGLVPHLDPRARPILFEKAAFDDLGPASISSIGAAARLAARLRTSGYERVVILHHLTTRWGAVKYRALALATGAPMIAGLDNGRGRFLTHHTVDRGFGFKHESTYMLEAAIAAGGKPGSAVPRFNIADETLPFDLPDSYVAIAPGAGSFSSARIWPLDRYVELGRMIAAMGKAIVVVGGSDTREAGKQITAAVGEDRSLDLTGQTSINETAIILRGAAATVGNDSFPVHLAAAVGAPVLAIFGPSNVDAWKPNSQRAATLTADLPCSPCLYTGYRLGRPEGCPARSCLDLISPVMALEATEDLLRA